MKPGRRVVVSAHTDTVFPNGLDLKLNGRKLSGTLDNIVGVFAVMRAYPKLQELGVRVFFPTDEELFMQTETRIARALRKQDPRTVAISVDVDEIESDIDVRVDNIHGLTEAQRESVLGMLQWHDIRFENRELDFSKPETADESWAYAQEGLPTFSLCIPVLGDFHTKNCRTTVDRIEKAAQAIIWSCLGIIDAEG